MKNKTKKISSDKKSNFIKEYNEIITSSETSVVIVSEWVKNGDYFQKLSMYDDNYTPIPTLGETTLINSL